MHFIFMTRGINEQVEARWKIFMQAQMFWFKQKPILKDPITHEFLKNPDGSYQYGPEHWAKVQGSLRPIQLWEYVFPEETLPYNKNLPYNTETLSHILAMMDLHKVAGDKQRSEVNIIEWPLRKILKLSKIPSFEELKKHEKYEITPNIIAGCEAVAVYPIGIRRDPIQDFIFINEDGTKIGFFQEGL